MISFQLIFPFPCRMDDGASPSRRPYIRLTSSLNNVTKSAGDEVRFKCEAAGEPLPLQFR